MSENLDEFSDKPIPQTQPQSDDSIPFLGGKKSKEDKEDKRTSARVQWCRVGPDQFQGAGPTQDILESGVYGISADARGEPVFLRRPINVDGMMEFPDSKSDSILTEIAHFWTRGSVFEKYGYLHRRGYLLYGPAGSGKTTIVQQTIQRIIKDGGLVFMCGSPKLFAEGLYVLRQIEPVRPVVCVYEDIDTIISNYGEDALLSTLDGENQINTVLNIATTNYPERLDKRIVARPRRFDRVLKIGMPIASVRELYFKHKLKIEDAELALWVRETDGFSFAAMAELVISVKCLDNKFTVAVDILRKLMVGKVSSEDFSEKMGFA